jgi:hypothetical protein
MYAAEGGRFGQYIKLDGDWKRMPHRPCRAVSTLSYRLIFLTHLEILSVYLDGSVSVPKNFRNIAHTTALLGHHFMCISILMAL